MENTLSITSERADDVVLLLHLFLKLELPTSLDRCIKRHGNQQGLSWGTLVTIWMAHILTTGDHRKLVVRAWVNTLNKTLEKTMGCTIRDTDFTDDRLSLALRHFSDIETWHKIEEELSTAILIAFELVPQVIRVDATTVSGYHQGGPGSLFQFGKSKEHPDLLCTKIMQTTLDPLGLPLTTAVVPGNRADDRLYVPAMERAITCLKKIGLLFVGDAKMSSFETRSFLQRKQQFYLVPLANIGETARLLPQWIQKAHDEPEIVENISLETDRPDQVDRGRGYSFERNQIDHNALSTPYCWKERVFVVYSPNHAKSLRHGLDERLRKATEQLKTLKPASSRNRTDKTEADLQKTVTGILKKCQVSGLLTYSIACVVQEETKYVGRGRGGPDRPQITVEHQSFRLENISVDETALASALAQLGWRAFVSNDVSSKMTVQYAVATYRKEYSIERGFHRLKGVQLSLAPLFVKRDDQVEGLIHLLTLCVRMLTLIEHRVRQCLERRGSGMKGIHLENSRKETLTPTAERLLSQFVGITFSTVRMNGVEQCHVTPLKPVQQEIMEMLELLPEAYSRLGNNSG